MTYGAWEIVGRNDHQLPLGKNVGDALRDLIRARFKTNAAKAIETRWGLDPKTARNVVSEGHVSERTLTKAALAERWELWMALGEELFGQSYVEWEELRLTKIMEDAARDLDRVHRLRPKAEALGERSFARDATGGVDGAQGAEPAGRGEGGDRVRTSRRRASGAAQ